MSEKPEAAERARLDSLMYRMLGGLLLLGAAVLLTLTTVLLRLPRVTADGSTLLLLPGTAGRHGLSPAALPSLGLGALILGLGGLAALALARRHVHFAVRVPDREKPRSFRRPALILLTGIALLAAVLLRR